MSIARPLLLTACLLQPVPLLADGVRDVRRSYVGVWAGERMLCSRPAKGLHVYGPAGTRHPAIFQDSLSYTCKVREVRGRWPEWTLDLNCTAFGTEDPSATLRATQTLALLEDGKLLRMRMLSARGEELWADDLHWCRAFKARHPMTRIH